MAARNSQNLKQQNEHLIEKNITIKSEEEPSQKDIENQQKDSEQFLDFKQIEIKKMTSEIVDDHSNQKESEIDSSQYQQTINDKQDDQNLELFKLVMPDQFKQFIISVPDQKEERDKEKKNSGGSYQKIH